MYKIKTNTCDISIDLDCGVYCFAHESSTGKTRLHDLMQTLSVLGEPVATYTYNDKLRGLNIERILVPNKYKVIILDRYDLYNGYGYDEIVKCMDNTIILIDCKSGLNFDIGDEIVDINMTEFCIEVS